MSDETAAYQVNTPTRLSPDQTRGPWAEGYFWVGKDKVSDAQNGVAHSPDGGQTTAKASKKK